MVNPNRCDPTRPDEAAQAHKIERHWEGSQPTICELNGEKLETAFVDGRLRFGGWGMWCPTCYDQFGSGFGTGRGQKYEKQSTGRWLKTAG